MTDSPAPAAPDARRLILLGSTGSIGCNTLTVIDHLDSAYDVVALAAGQKASALIEQAQRFDVNHLAMADAQAAEQVRNALPQATVYAGPDAARQLVDCVEADVLVTAVVGAAGLPATISALQRGMTIGLANKETLVAAGELVMPLAAKHKAAVLPIDSEHSAIFQCLQGHCEPVGPPYPHVKRIVLTASGGPFRTAPREKIHNATVTEALDHPTWNMGPKITIDSATMMNKALEVIEAHWLFGLSADQIDVIIHPQSIVHSFVEFTDRSVLAQLGSPDMKTPIQYALTWPDRAPGCSEPMDFAKLSRLDFEQPDHDRFPALKLAYRVIEQGQTSGAVLNAANEAAVAAFLDGRIRFGQIVELVGQTLDAIDIQPATDLQTILDADRQARHFVAEQLDQP